MRIFLLYLLLTAMPLSAQNFNVHLVYLHNKDQSQYSVFRPQEFLSPRAVERKSRQGIKIDESDLPLNSNYINQINQTGAEIILHSKWLNAVSVYVSDSSILKKIKNLPFVKESKAIGFKKNKSETKLAEHFPFQEYKKEETIFGATLNQIAMLGGHLMQQMQFEGNGIQVAIFDGGFSSVYRMPAFDSLFAQNRILGTRDFVEGDEFVYESSTHGTNVLSCMAANLPYQVMGTAPKASYYLFKTEDVGSEYYIEELNWVVAAEYADSLGVDVINSSLGYTSFNDPKMNYKYSDMNGKNSICSPMASLAVQKGMLVVNSAGNEGDGAWHYIGVPADAEHVISVGATKPDGSRVGFSSCGPTYDQRVKPTVSAQGNRVVVAASKGYGYQLTDGTSFSSPILAGMVASLWSAFPEKSNWEIKDAMEASANQTNRPDSLLGYGIPDFFVSYLYLKDGGVAISEKGQVFDRYQFIDEYFDVIVELGLKENQFNSQITQITGELVIQKNMLVKDKFITRLLYDEVKSLPNGSYLLTLQNESYIFRIPFHVYH